MRYSILFSILILFLLSCSKNKFNTVPSLKFKSVNTTVLHQHQLLVLRLSFTDAEGDFTVDSSLYVQEKVLNCSRTSAGFKSYYPLPDFPTTKNQEGDIIVTYGYRAGNIPLSDPQCQKNDTSIFKFVLRDKAHHNSDTAFSDKIVIVY